MMKGVKKEAMACRLPNGEIDLEVWDIKRAERNARGTERCRLSGGYSTLQTAL